jgi:hypothetical protein
MRRLKVVVVLSIILVLLTNGHAFAQSESLLNSSAFALGFEFYLWDIAFPEPEMRQSLAKEIQTKCQTLNLKLKPPLEEVQEEKLLEIVEKYLQDSADALGDKPERQQIFLLGCIAGRAYHIAVPQKFFFIKVKQDHREELIKAVEDIEKQAQEVKLPQRFLTDLKNLKEQAGKVRNHSHLTSINQGLFEWSREVIHYLAGSKIRQPSPLESVVSKVYTLFSLAWLAIQYSLSEEK